MIDSEFCIKCGRPYAMYGIWYCDSCIKDMLHKKNAIIQTGKAWNTEKADPMADIKQAIEEVKDNVGFQLINPKKRLEVHIKKRTQKLLDNSKRKQL